MIIPWANSSLITVQHEQLFEKDVFSFDFPDINFVWKGGCYTYLLLLLTSMYVKGVCGNPVYRKTSLKQHRVMQKRRRNKKDI